MIDVKVKLHLAKLLGMRPQKFEGSVSDEFGEEFDPTDDVQFGQLAAWCPANGYIVESAPYSIRLVSIDEPDDTCELIHDNTPLGIKEAFCNALYRATGGSDDNQVR